jgi:ABC-type uncharacterized transport system involved in gliding motility auxiliary subunit
MILIGILLGTSVFAMLLAASFGDISFHLALNLIFGILALTTGTLTLVWQTINWHRSTQSLATRSARQFAKPGTMSWSTILGTTLAATGAAVVFLSLRA